MTFLLSAFIALTLIVSATVIHYAGLRRIGRHAETHGPRRLTVLILVLVSVVAVHISEIALHAFAYPLGEDFLGLRSFHSSNPINRLGLYYDAAETSSALGYGDIYPAGDIRLIASFGPLNGILLLAWSGSFLFGMVPDRV